MRKIVLFMHVTLDGFVGGPNGEMDWIHVDGDMFELAGNETDKADTALYGRVTYEMMEAYWPTAGDQPNATKHDTQHSQWYNGVEKVVVSHTMKNSETKKIKVVGEDLYNEITTLKQQRGKNILIFGSPRAAHALMHYNLVDDYWLFINPVILGNGIPMFADIEERIKLRLVSSKVFSSGVVALHYEKES